MLCVGIVCKAGWALFLENSWFFSIFKAMEIPWKRIWCIKVLEFGIRGPWKCSNSKIVNDPIVQRMVQSLENYKQYSEQQYRLLVWCCVTCWKLPYNGFGKSSWGCLTILEKSLILFPPKHWPDKNVWCCLQCLWFFCCLHRMIPRMIGWFRITFYACIDIVLPENKTVKVW